MMNEELKFFGVRSCDCMRAFLGFLVGINAAGAVNSYAHGWYLIMAGQIAVVAMLVTCLVITAGDE